AQRLMGDPPTRRRPLDLDRARPRGDRAPDVTSELARKEKTIMRRRRARLVIAVALVLAAAFPWGVGAQDKVVRCAASLSLTGNLADNARLVKDGYDFYVKHVNERFGGIN